MVIEPRVHCDGPDCGTHQQMWSDDRFPQGWHVLQSWINGKVTRQLHFCKVECNLRWAAAQEPPTIIAFGNE